MDLIVPNAVVQIGFDRVHFAVADIDATLGVMKTKLEAMRNQCWARHVVYTHTYNENIYNDYE